MYLIKAGQLKVLESIFNTNGLYDHTFKTVSPNHTILKHITRFNYLNEKHLTGKQMIKWELNATTKSCPIISSSSCYNFTCWTLRDKTLSRIYLKKWENNVLSNNSRYSFFDDKQRNHIPSIEHTIKDLSESWLELI